MLMIQFGELSEDELERYKKALEAEKQDGEEVEYKYIAEAEEDEVEPDSSGNNEFYQEQAPGYYETKYDFPVCNHKEQIGDDNIGFSIGITASGVPFEAEIHTDGENMSLTVIMPSIFDPNAVDEDTEEDKEDGNILGFRNTYEMVDNGILDIGMVDDGEEDDDNIVKKYVGFLEDAEIVSFASNILNGTVQYRVDVLGNDLTKIIITLKEGDDFWAYTDLDFRSFKPDKEDREKRVISMDEFLKRQK